MGQELSSVNPEALDSCQEALREIEDQEDNYGEWDDKTLADRLNEASNCYELALEKMPDEDRKKYLSLKGEGLTRTELQHIPGHAWPNGEMLEWEVKQHDNPLTPTFGIDKAKVQVAPQHYPEIKISAWTYLLEKPHETMNQLWATQQMRKQALAEIKEKIPDEKERKEWLQNGDGTYLFEYAFESRTAPRKRLHALPQPKRRNRKARWRRPGRRR